MRKLTPAMSKEKELKLLENEYRGLLKNVPISYNETRRWHISVQKCVTRMRTLRSIRNKNDLTWLQEILTREATP